ncbi:fimbrial protein [Serratia fonticola]|uniref:fimbrial protein n=1 Tax=Serratia fonticola TaxID=47917 RepID=UPI0021BB3A4E|nr:fimbrial protein [Serratia fonticola]
MSVCLDCYYCIGFAIKNGFHQAIMFYENHEKIQLNLSTLEYGIIFMKKNLLTAALFTMAFSLSAGALAADGTINFQGVVNSTTCTLDTGSQDLTVMLPSIKSSDFASANSAATSPTVKFSLKATGCEAGTVSAAAVFATGGNVDVTNGNLNNTYTDGTDAQVRIYMEDGTTPINLANFGESTNNVGTVNGNDVTIDFHANYFSKNTTATPGLLRTSIQYSMQYL